MQLSLTILQAWRNEYLLGAAINKLQAILEINFLRKRIIKYIILSISIILLGIIGLTAYGVLSWIGFFDYSAKEVIENYNKRSNDFTNLAEYFNSILPINTGVKIEFKSRHFINKCDIQASGKWIHLKNISTKSSEVDTLFQLTRWNQSNLSELYKRLKAVNSISIQSNYYMPGEKSCEVGFQRRGNGVFYYLLFEPPIPDSLKGTYNDSCHHVLINNRAAIFWYVGSIGPDCLYGNRQPGK